MPSEFPGHFPIVPHIVSGNIAHSKQQDTLGRAINARILSGLGDVTWRSLWAAYSLVRNFRNGDGGSPEVFPPEDEWWQLYGLYEETDWDWPAADVGMPTGLNKDSPINSFFFGSTGAIEDEDERLNSNVPLRDPPVTGLAPTTPLEFWDLGKEQRGAILSTDLTDFSKAWCMHAARMMEDHNSSIGTLSGFHKTAGGKIQDNSDDWIREKGQQWNQMRTQFMKEYRGTAAERNDDSDWSITDLCVEYERIFNEQWLLAPSYGNSVGSLGDVAAQYPLFEWDLLDAAGTYGVYTWEATEYTTWSSRTGFVFVGFILVGSNLGASPISVAIEIDGVQKFTMSVDSTDPESMIWVPASPLTGDLKIKLLTTLTGSQDIYVEVAELLEFKPEVFDVYVLMRMANARANAPTIYRGNIISSAKDISDSYFNNGCIYNSTNATVPIETKVAKHPQYQAMRDFLMHWFRIINYDRLKGYYVNGEGDSVLVFDRRGMGDSDADIFRNLAPQEDSGAGGASKLAVTSILEGVWYEVVATGGSPSGSVTYDGTTYEIGDSFRGTYVTGFTFNSPVNIAVNESHFLIDIDDIDKMGESNEWVFTILGQTPYKDDPLATYKPEAYGNVYGTFHDRCHTFSEAMDGSTGSAKGKAFNKYGSLQSSPSAVVTRCETPPGHRYAGDDVPYWGAGAKVFTQIQTADGASEADCRDSIFTEYVSGGVGVDDLLSGDCAGISAHYESCKVFKAPYLIKSISWEGSTKWYVEVTLRGRLEKSDTAPASIADTSASRTTYLSTDTGPRTDENTVVALLKWKVDAGTEDEERIGDVSPNADSDYNAADIRGSVLCRFGMQRLFPKVWNDNDAYVQKTRDRRGYSDHLQYAEFIIRAGVGGFLDEQRIEDTLQYQNPPLYHAFCDSQDSRDWTMPNLLAKIGSSDDRIAHRKAGESRGGYGVLPHTLGRADQYTELAKCLNELKSSRFEVPVYLESKTTTYWDYGTAEIETIEGFSIVRNHGFVKPTTVRNSPAWTQEFIPFSDSALAYMTIWDGGDGGQVLYYWREVEWRMRPHPKVLEAVPEILRDYVDTLGLALPWLYEPPSLIKSHLDRDPLPGDTAVTDFTTLVTIQDEDEYCEIGQSGTLKPSTPPTGDLAVSSISSGSPGSVEGDAESYSHAGMHIEQTGETYIRVPVK